MAFQFDKRAKILVGVVVVVGVAAGAWFFFLDDFLNAPPPKTVVKAAAKPAAVAAKGAPEAAKPAAEAPKAAAEAPKPAAQAAAPAAAKPEAAKPVPTNPDKLIAEIIEISGVKGAIQNFGREVARSASEASQADKQKMGNADVRAIFDVVARTFEPQQMAAEVTAKLKAGFDQERMTRFLEILRQPLALKMAAMETRQTPPEETQRLLEDIRKNPPTGARQKLVQALDDITQSSETGVQLATMMARELIDAVFTELQKAGKQVPKEARQVAGTQIVAAQGSMRGNFRTLFYLTYRDASDEELAGYIKLLDTDTGRWGLQLLANAQREVVESRVRGFAKDVAQIAMRQALAKGVAPQPAPGPAEEKPAEKLASAAPPAPAPEPPAYQRPANIRDLYTRYNDLITATVMGDRAAVKELLDDGKFPDVRQKDGVTPLMVAASNGDTAIAEMLLAKGADPNLRAAGGTTALSLARERGRADMVRLLQSKGAKE